MSRINPLADELVAERYHAHAEVEARRRALFDKWAELTARMQARRTAIERKHELEQALHSLTEVGLVHFLFICRY